MHKFSNGRRSNELFERDIFDEDSVHRYVRGKFPSPGVLPLPSEVNILEVIF